MGCQVIALEADPQLAARAPRAGVRDRRWAACSRPQGGAPYDLILIDGAVEQVPDAIIKQLGGSAAGSARRCSSGGLRG